MNLAQLLALLATQPAPQELVALAVAVLTQVQRQGDVLASPDTTATVRPHDCREHAAGNPDRVANLCDQLRRTNAEALETERRLSQLVERCRSHANPVNPPAVPTTCDDSATDRDETPAVLFSLEALDRRIHQITVDLVYLGIQLNGATFDSHHESHPPQVRAHAQRTALAVRHRMEHLEALLHELDQQRRDMLECCGLPNLHPTEPKED
jgi:hypothetical protein